MHGRRWVYDRGRRSRASGVYARVRVGSKYIKRRVYKHRSLLVDSKALTVRGMVEKKKQIQQWEMSGFSDMLGDLERVRYFRCRLGTECDTHRHTGK